MKPITRGNLARLGYAGLALLMVAWPSYRLVWTPFARGDLREAAVSAAFLVLMVAVGYLAFRKAESTDFSGR